MSTAEKSAVGSRQVNKAGVQFYWLTSIRKVGLSNDRSEVWEFKCVCGGSVEAAFTRVRNGYTKSCGCRRAAQARKHATPMLGRRFGRLVVLERQGSNEHRASLWKCACDCGGSTIAVGNSLRKGVVNSCGCLKVEMFVRQAKARKLTDEQRAESAKRRRKNSNRRESRRLRTDPVFRLRRNVASMLRFALKRLDLEKTERSFKMLGYSPAELQDHLERQFHKGMSWANYGEWQIDHIVPLCTAETKGDVVRLNALSNLRPLWKEENMRKNGRIELLC